jgi:hypothetical protein
MQACLASSHPPLGPPENLLTLLETGEEKERQASPNLTPELWDEVLKDTGFSGNDIEIPDCEDVDGFATSAIMSTAVTATGPKLPPAEDCLIVYSNRSPPPEEWLGALRQTLGQDATFDGIVTLESAPKHFYANKICIFVGEAGDSALLDSLDSEGLAGIKAMATACQGLLWVTRGGSLNCEKPEHSLAAGFLRSLRNEYVGRKLLTLDLDSASPAWSTVSISTITQILMAKFGQVSSSSLSDAASISDFEYVERSGVVLVPRLFKDMARNKAITPDPVSDDVFETAPLHQPSRRFRGR